MLVASGVLGSRAGPRLTLALLILAACSEPSLLWVPIPPTEGARSLVVAMHRQRGPSALAFDLDAWDQRLYFSTDFDAQPTYRLEALTYDRSLAALELPSGPLHAAPGSGNGGVMPTPNAAFTLDIGVGGTLTQWASASGASSALASFQVLKPPPATSSACQRFTATLHEHPFNEEGEFALRVDSQSALLGIRNQPPRIVGTGTATVVQVEPSWVTPAGLWRAPDDTLWVAERFGRLFKGRLVDNKLTVQQMATNPRGGTMRWIDGGIVDGDVELFTLSEDGKLSRYYRERWTLLHEYDVPRAPDFLGGLVWRGPGQAVAVWPFAFYTVRVDMPNVERDMMGVSQTGVGKIPGLGIVVGGGTGAFFVLEGETWRELGQSDVGISLHSIVPFRGGFLYGDQIGFVGQYVTGQGFCEPAHYAAHKVIWLVPLDDNRVVAYGDRPDLFTRLPYTVLTTSPE